MSESSQSADVVQTVLFCPAHATSLSEMRLIATRLKQEAPVKVIFIIAPVKLRAEIPSLKSQGFECIDINPDGSVAPSRVDSLSHRLCVALIARGFQPPRSLLRRGLDIYRYLEYFDSRTAQILRETQPWAVAIPDDRSFAMGFLPMLLKNCRKYFFVTVIVPISYAAGPADLIKSLSRRSRNVEDGHWMCKLYPGQLYRDLETGKRFSYYSPLETRILDHYGALPENPWVMGGGLSDWVLADGKETRARYRAQGCKPAKIAITGHCSHDTLLDLNRRRAHLRDKLATKLACVDPLLIMALPQLGEHRILHWDRHWIEIRYLCKVASQWSDRTLISLHPKMDFENYRFVEEEYGLTISAQSLREILPAADLFVATYSSTVQWAVLCRIPSVVVDFYDLNYTEFENLGGVEFVSDREVFEIKISELMRNESVRRALGADAERAADSISPFDGSCGARIAKFLLGSDAFRKSMAGTG